MCARCTPENIAAICLVGELDQAGSRLALASLLDVRPGMNLHIRQI